MDTAAAAPLTTSEITADPEIELVDTTVAGVLRQRAGEHPDRPALVGTAHGSEVETRLSYAELLDAAERVATGLRGMAQPGDFVALWAPNVVEWPIIQYGAAMAGVVLVALNPVLRPVELEYALAHSGATVLLHADRSRDYDMAAVAAGLPPLFPHLTVVSLSDRARWFPGTADPAVVADEPTDADLPVMLQYTSGTTGKPKGVLLRHRSLVNVARLTMEFVGFPRAALSVNPLPMFHTAACVVATIGPLWLGGTTYLVHTFTPDGVLGVLRREHADAMFFVPAVLGAVVEAQRASTDPAPRLTMLLGGAAPVSAALIEATESMFGAWVSNVFGQTELAPVLAGTRVDDSREQQLSTVGHPIPGVDVKVVDPATGLTQPLGVTGEICARGYQQLIEYLHDPVSTAQTVDADGFVHTGDLGSMDERGYLTLSGRLKDLINRGGEKIAPVEIELCLAGHPAVLEAVVFALPDQRMGEVVAAAVRVRESTPDLAAVLRDHARAQLSPHKVPTRWFISEGFPATPTGKVQKFRLPQLIDTPALREVHPSV